MKFLRVWDEARTVTMELLPKILKPSIDDICCSDGSAKSIDKRIMKHSHKLKLIVTWKKFM